jgi:hypothetical protein
MRLAHLIPLGVGLALLLAAGVAHAGPVVAIAAAIAGASAATALGLSGFAAIAFRVGFSLIVSGIFGKKSEPTQDTGQQNSFTAEAQGRQQIVRSNVAARQLVYGEVLQSGPLIFAATSGTDNTTLDLVIALAPHQVQAIGDIYLNDELLGDLDSGGAVTTGRFATYVRITKYLGAQTSADAGLIARHPSKWTSAHVGFGVAYIIVTLTYNRDVFPQGIPNIKAVIKGALLHDPRTGTRAFSTNWALVVRDYLTRPAIEGGMAAESSEVDDTANIAAANVCDERIAMAPYSATATASAATNRFTYTAAEIRIATGDAVTLSSTGVLPAPLLGMTTYYAIRLSATTAQVAATYAEALAGTAIDLTTDGNGSHTLQHISQARYTVNGTVDTSKKPVEILRGLMSAACGVLTYPNGKFTLFPAAYTTPEVTIDENDLRGPINLLPAPARRELFNAVRGTYADPSKAWQPGDFPPVRNVLYSAQDNGEEIFRDLEFGYSNGEVLAQRLAKIVLEKSRQGITVEMPVKINDRTFGLSVWSTVLVDNSAFGWSGKVFRVTKWRLAQDGQGLDLTLREDSAASYDWAYGDATTRDPAPDTDLPSPFVAGVPSAPSVTETLYQTTGSAGVKTRADVTWSAPTDPFILRYEAQFKADNDPETAWIALASVSLLAAQVIDLAPGRYDFRVRALNTLGVRSAWSPTTTVDLQGLFAVPGDVTGFSVIATGGLALASWTITGDLDVRLGGRVWIRHSPLTSGATWENGVVLERFAGGMVNGTLPLVTGTYMAKFEDSSGRFSATMASFVASEGMVTGLSTLATITESTGFAGSKTQLVVDGVTLKLNRSGDIDSEADFDAIPNLDELGEIYGTGTYLFNTVYDGTTKAVRRFEADIAVTSVDEANSVDDWPDFDNVDNIDATEINSTDVTLYAATTDDNPAGSPTWGGWTQFHVADFNCRAAKFKLEFESGNPTHNIAVSTLAVVVKA